MQQQHFGATTIEKHLTINTNMKGPDHSSSLNVKKFSEFVKSIRNTEKIILNNLTKFLLMNHKIQKL